MPLNVEPAPKRSREPAPRAGRWSLRLPALGGERRPTEEATVLAIASGKGGTGKSFVATNLAVAMSRRGLRVTLVDCDFGLGSDHLLLGVDPPRTVQHVLNGEASIDDVRVATPYGPGLIAGGSGLSRLADLDDRELSCLAQSLGGLAANQDVLLLDTAAGISPQVILTLLAAHRVVVVTNPELAALTDAYALVKCLARQVVHPPVSVVVNRVPDRGAGAPAFARLADVAERFAKSRLHDLGWIPEDPAVTHRRLGQPPLLASHPQCAVALAVERVLERLQTMEPLGRRPVGAGGAFGARLRRYLTLRSGF